MNNEGFGTNGVPFEYTIEKKGKNVTRRKILLMIAYVAWVIVFFTTGVLVKLILPLLCFIPISLWIIIFFTWRFTKEEIKISLFGGTVSITRMYDGKNLKKLFEFKIKDVKKMEKYSADALNAASNVVYAVQNGACEGAYVLSLENSVVVMETNEKAMKIIRYYNSSLFES